MAVWFSSANRLGVRRPERNGRMNGTLARQSEMKNTARSSGEALTLFPNGSTQ